MVVSRSFKGILLGVYLYIINSEKNPLNLMWVMPP